MHVMALAPESGNASGVGLADGQWAMGNGQWGDGRQTGPSGSGGAGRSGEVLARTFVDETVVASGQDGTSRADLAHSVEIGESHHASLASGRWATARYI